MPYDMEHLVTYLRILDAEVDGADWAEVAHIVLHIDPSREPARARRAWHTHFARAKWMTEHGYRQGEGFFTACSRRNSASRTACTRSRI
jgi:hypothetical protein